MVRYIVLIRFTESGIGAIKDSTARADAFKAEAAKAGASIESVYWTQGPYDGVLTINAPDESTAAALVLSLGQRKSVQTTMLRAFDAGEFSNVLGKLN